MGTLSKQARRKRPTTRKYRDQEGGRLERTNNNIHHNKHKPEGRTDSGCWEGEMNTHHTYYVDSMGGTILLGVYDEQIYSLPKI